MNSEPLEAANYRPYGDVVAARPDVQPKSANMGTAARFNHLGALENLRQAKEGHKDAAPNLCVFQSQPFTGKEFTVTLLERHAHSTQVFIPMNAKRYLVVVCLGRKDREGRNDEAAPDLKTLRGFIAQGNQGITYRPGVWHHPLIALDQVTDFACLVWENGSADDCDTHPLDTPVTIRL